MYSSFQSVEAKGWNSRDTLVFDLPEVENHVTCEVDYGLRVWRNYKYENCILVAKLYEDKKVVSSDVLEFTISNERGEQGGSGLNFLEYKKSLKHRYTLKPKKKYKVKVTHLMRLDPLDGVGNVGVTIASSGFVQHPFSGK